MAHCARACTGDVQVQGRAAPSLTVPSEAVIRTGDRRATCSWRAPAAASSRAASGLVRAKANAPRSCQGLAAGDTVVAERLVPDRLREPAQGRDGGNERAVADRRTAPVIGRIIEYCATHRALVFLFTAFAVLGSLVAMRRVPLDAIPDLSRSAGDRVHRVDGPEPRPGRGPDHLSDRLVAARRAAGRGGARPVDVRHELHLRDLRGRHRPLLGAQPRARVPEHDPRRACRRASARSSGPTRLRSAGCSSTRSWTAAGATTSPTCARSRTSTCATRSRACRASPRWRRSAAIERQYQVEVDPGAAARVRTVARRRHRRRSGAATRTSADA